MSPNFEIGKTRVSNINVKQALKKRICQLLIARSKGQKMKLSNRTKDAFGISKMSKKGKSLNSRSIKPSSNFFLIESDGMQDHLLTISGPVVLYDSYKIAYRILTDKENWKVESLPRYDWVYSVKIKHSRFSRLIIA